MPSSAPKQRRPNAVPGTADALERGERPAPRPRGIEASDPSLRQPHERDESADPDATGPSVEGRRAASDVAAGRTDTDRRSAGTDVKEPGRSRS